MAVQCPFCGTDWTELAIMTGGCKNYPADPEAFQCDCGAWWYKGMEDVEDD